MTITTSSRLNLTRYGAGSDGFPGLRAALADLVDELEKRAATLNVESAPASTGGRISLPEPQDAHFRRLGYAISSSAGAVTGIEPCLRWSDYLDAGISDYTDRSTQALRDAADAARSTGLPLYLNTDVIDINPETPIDVSGVSLFGFGQQLTQIIAHVEDSATVFETSGETRLRRLRFDSPDNVAASAIQVTASTLYVDDVLVHTGLGWNAGAIRVEGTGALVVHRCRIIAPTSASAGYGLWVDSGASVVTHDLHVEGCVEGVHCAAGALSSRVVLRDSLFHANDIDICTLNDQPILVSGFYSSGSGGLIRVEPSNHHARVHLEDGDIFDIPAGGVIAGKFPCVRWIDAHGTLTMNRVRMQQSDTTETALVNIRVESASGKYLKITTNGCEASVAASSLVTSADSSTIKQTHRAYRRTAASGAAQQRVPSIVPEDVDI